MLHSSRGAALGLPVLGPLSRLLLLGALLGALVLGDRTAARSNPGGGIADRVLGQPDFTTGDPNHFGLNGQSLSYPVGIAVDPVSGRLFVADQYNNRVLSWPSASGFANGQAADLVLGQPDLTHTQFNQGGQTSASTLWLPSAVALDGSGNLYVAEQNNNRVVMYASPFANGMAATRVFGQPDFAHYLANNGQGSPSAASLHAPQGVAVDPSGDVFMADTQNGRVLEYVAPFVQNQGIAASNVFGAADFSHYGGIWGIPTGVATDAGGNLWIADSGFNRVLEFVPPFSASGNQAGLVLGQPDFTHGNAGVSPTGLSGPTGVAVDPAGAYVADHGANRVVRYLAPYANGMAASFVIGQTGCGTGAPNSGGIGPASLYGPVGLATDPGGHLYVADGFNDRVLGYSQPGPGASCGGSPWSYNPSHVMGQVRTYHTATLLDAGPNAGKVPVTGGYITGGATDTTELYDPATDTWGGANAMLSPRGGHTATLLPDHRVVVVGGSRFLGADAEIYDPNADTWTETGSSANVSLTLASPCYNVPPTFSTTLLSSGPNAGKVLVVGADNRNHPASELFDPATGGFTPTPSNPAHVHYDGTTTLLTRAGGKVLLAGGFGATPSPCAQATPANLPSSAAELYDPLTGAWTPAAPLPGPLAGHTATELADGHVLLAGGSPLGTYTGAATTVYLYSPSANTWAGGQPLLTPRRDHLAALLDSGKVLVDGGTDAGANYYAEYYDPVASTWTGDLTAPRAAETTITRLANGTFLIAPPTYFQVSTTQCQDTGSFGDIPCEVCTLVSSTQVVGAAWTFNPAALSQSSAGPIRPAAGGPATAGRTPPVAAPGARPTAAATDPVLATLWALRDEVMAASPQGQFYTRLYYLHSPELVAIVLAHPDLFLWSLATLREWQPPLQALVNGQGSGATISPQMESDLNGVLNEFSQFGSPGLVSDIQQEQTNLNLPSFVNLPMDQAWGQAQQRIVVRPLPTTYLPLVAR